MPDPPLQNAPRERDGAGWAVFEHLAHEASAVGRMTRPQQLVFAINHLRQEVHSGGFDVYLRYTGGNTLPLAREAAALLGPEWVSLVDDVLEVMRSPYPHDADERAARLDGLLLDRPDLLQPVDDRLYALENEHDVDERIDQFVWSNAASFFHTQPPSTEP